MKTIMSVAAVVATLLLGASCTSVEYSQSGLPEGYSGDTATIRDTFYHPGPKRAYFYYVESVDSVLVENAPFRTNEATKTYAKGERLWPVSASRSVPAKELQLTIGVSETILQPIATFATPSNENPRFRKTITFVPEAGQRYRVRGTQSWQGEAVWLETSDGRKVSEVVGNAALYHQLQRVTGEVPLRQARFLATVGGETGEEVKSRLGEPDKTRREEKRKHIFDYERVLLHYDGLGLVELNEYKSSLYVEHLHREKHLKQPKLLFEFMLTVPEPDKRHVARRIYRTERPLDQELMDRMAAYVWYNRHSDSYHMLDAAALLCKVLSKHGHGRYNAFLEKVADSTSSRRISRNARKSINEYIRSGIDEFILEESGFVSN